MIIGPMFELELPNPGDVVPAGVVISPAHFMTIPLDQFRGTLDNDGDVHYVLKITKVGEEFTVKKYPNTGRFDSKFCLEADIGGESLCYITTGIFGFGKRAVCCHSAIKTFYTVHDTRICPQRNNALSLFVVCEGSTERFEKKTFNENKFPFEDLGMEWDFNIEPSLTKVYKLETTLGRKTTEYSVSHELLCKYNGVLLLGSLEQDYQNVDCKEIDFCNVVFVASGKNEGEESFKSEKKVGRNFRCEHPEDCNKKFIAPPSGTGNRNKFR